MSWRGSMVKSKVPAGTSCPSAKCTFITSPWIMDCTPDRGERLHVADGPDLDRHVALRRSATVTGTAGGAPLAVAGSGPCHSPRAGARPGAARPAAPSCPCARGAASDASASENRWRNSARSLWNAGSDEERPVTIRVTWGKACGYAISPRIARSRWPASRSGGDRGAGDRAGRRAPVRATPGARPPGSPGPPRAERLPLGQPDPVAVLAGHREPVAEARPRSAGASVIQPARSRSLRSKISRKRSSLLPK